MGQSVSVPASLQPYVTVARLVDLLDFSRVTFEKQISLAPKQKTLQTQRICKYPSKRTGELFDIKIGRTPERSNPNYFCGSNLWVSIADMKQKYITDTKEKISDEAAKVFNIKLVPKGTVLYSFKLTIGRVAIAGDNLYTNEAIAAFIPKRGTEKIISNEYLYYFLKSGLVSFEDKTANIFGRSLNLNILRQIQIPIPPLEVQAQIVAECQAIDDEAARAEENIRRLTQETLKVLQDV
jgi:restriction endonuclease S subunit